MIVIADDITGAAEIAGIAFSQGQQVRLVCGGLLCRDNVAAQTTVIATDTRSMSEAEAAAETRRIASLYRGEVEGGLLFKKTDSALRGHVIAELSALMETTGFQRAVYLPANPSKGRVIRGGTYYINNVPVHETDFSFDPEFPVKTSDLRARFPNAESKGIIMPNAETICDIRRVVALYHDGKTLFAGAADLFTVLLESDEEAGVGRTSSRLFDIGKSTLILCGSTQSKPLEIGIPIAPLPQTVYDGSDDLSLWDTTAYQQQHNIILTIPHTHRTGKEVATHLRSVMATMTRRLVEFHRPDHLIIEGGATAWAVLNALGWTQFDVVRQIAPGVVQMRAESGSLVTLKPGSYPWGPMFQSFSE